MPAQDSESSTLIARLKFFPGCRADCFMQLRSTNFCSPLTR